MGAAAPKPQQPKEQPAIAPKPGTLRRAAPWLALLAVIATVIGIRFYFAGQGQSVIDSPPNDAQAQAAAQLLASASSSVASTSPAATALPAGLPADQIRAMVRALPPQVRLVAQPGVELWGGAYPAASPPTGTFTRVDGPAVGFAALPLPPWYQTMQPGANQFAPLAVGDINGDGWPDVAVGTAYGVFLYVNVGGRFVQQAIDYPQMRSWTITAVALVDLDGAGLPDLVFCAWKQGCHILWNMGGSFSGATQTELPRFRELAVQALAFADVEHTGRLDIATGASTYLEWNFTPRGNVNYLWHNLGNHRFAPEALAGPQGETTSLLFANLTGGRGPDLYVGNDFDEPDLLFANVGGTLRKVDAQHSPLPYTTTTSMSADTGDIDNSGRPALYLAQIAQSGADPGITTEQPVAPGTACNAFADAADARNCLALSQFQTGAVRARDMQDVSQCRHLPDAVEERDCVAIGYYWNEAFVNLPNLHADRNAVLGECALMPADLGELQDVCHAASGYQLDYGQFAQSDPSDMHQVADTNLLFTPSGATYRDVTKSMGVGFGGWTWNAKFADLANDTWQDLYLTQGSRLRYTSVSNIVYRNLGGARFADQTAAFGLEDHVPTGGSVFLDANMDGRLDIISYPFDLTPVLWGNDLATAPGLQISLDDRRSDNRAGIGARVEIRAKDGRLQTRDIKAGGGYESFDEPVAHFGLGDWGQVDSITVIWPDGQTQVLSGLGLGAGRYQVVRLP